jgi:hypothetical protein
MRHTKADTDRLCVRRKEERGLLTNRSDIHSRDNIPEYVDTKYKADQFVNIVKSHESNQTNTNSTGKTAAKFAEA